MLLVNPTHDFSPDWVLGKKAVLSQSLIKLLGPSWLGLTNFFFVPIMSSLRTLKAKTWYNFLNSFQILRCSWQAQQKSETTGSILTMVESVMMDRSQWQANQSKKPRFRSVEVCIIHILGRCVKLLAVQHVSSMQCWTTDIFRGCSGWMESGGRWSPLLDVLHEQCMTEPIQIL